MKNFFVIFTDERYSELCRVLLDGLETFSKAKVIIVSTGFDFRHPHPGMLSVRNDFEFTGMCDFSMRRLDYLKKIPGPFIMLDADMVPNWNVDELFSLCDHCDPSFQQPAVCGFFDPKISKILNPMAGFTYCNMVPLISGKDFSEWLDDLWPSFMECGRIHREIHDGCEIDDEKSMNWVRCMSQKSSRIGIVSSDRFLFPVYLSDEIGKPEKMGDLYHCDKHVSWHLFHGEKDPEVARKMLEEIKGRGPDFLYRNAWRNRKPKIFS
ncbi:MAG: hypothetical protein O2960_20080 [Verrucomicrobia bacterium]|jgi:hypothetical protein|nr:hypothetical protein [Verrucomicrobiota bacterium]